MVVRSMNNFPNLDAKLGYGIWMGNIILFVSRILFGIFI